MPFRHEPVLLSEVIELLDPHLGDSIVDATIGGGGHGLALLEKTGKTGRLLGIDLDQHALAATRARVAETEFSERAVLVEDHFENLETVAKQNGFENPNIIFFDLGLSSHLIDDPAHGLSFQREGPLDMRFGPRSGVLTAADIVNTYSEDDIAGLLLRNSDERRARVIAKAIVAQRRAEPFTTTSALAAVVGNAVGGRRGTINPATKTFQALRIAVNHEREGLRNALLACQNLLASGGRLGVISYHSGEDRIAKRAFQRFAREYRWHLITKRVVRPEPGECAQNPRARSAKLRVIKKP